MNAPLKNAAVALVCHCILTILLLWLTPLGLYSLVIANCLYGLQVCIMNQKVLRRKIRYKQEVRRTYILPLLASLIMGAIVWCCYYGLFALTKKVFIPLIFSIGIGIIIYFVIILYMYAEHPQDLQAIPYLNKIVYKVKRVLK